MTLDVLDERTVGALAGLLDRPAPASGDPLPLMWHLVHHLPRPAQAELGPDGHPAVGYPTPPAPGLRRMFAGGRVAVVGAGPRVGARTRAQTEVVATREKQGRDGVLHFATTRTTHRVDDEVVLTDERDIVYLPATSAAASAPATAGPDAPLAGVRERIAAAAASRSVEVDPRLLFRFSALTYNAHRIHYDAAWARDVEGYDGLVVHGPLQALLMAEVGTQAEPGATGIEYRLVAPLLDHQGLHVVAEVEDGATLTRVLDHTGRETARGRLTTG